MLRFNLLNRTGRCFFMQFQYILCYGSTQKSNSIINIHFPFQYILCYGSTVVPGTIAIEVLNISIHLMLRFNLLQKYFRPSLSKFQYILCYGSTVRVGTRLSSNLKFQYILCYGSTLKIYLIDYNMW